MKKLIIKITCLFYIFCIENNSWAHNLIEDVYNGFHNDSPLYYEAQITFKAKSSQLATTQEEEDLSSLSIAIYKEYNQEDIHIYIKNLNNDNYIFHSFYKDNKKNTHRIIENNDYILENFLKIFFLEYMDWGSFKYNYRRSKENRNFIFYDASLKVDKVSSLYRNFKIKVSKKYNIPIEYILKNDNEITVISVDEVTMVNNKYHPLRYSIKTKNKKIIIQVNNIISGMLLEIDNNFKITTAEFQNKKDNIKMNLALKEIENLKQHIDKKEKIEEEENSKETVTTTEVYDKTISMNEINNLQAIGYD